MPPAKPGRVRCGHRFPMFPLRKCTPGPRGPTEVRIRPRGRMSPLARCGLNSSLPTSDSCRSSVLTRSGGRLSCSRHSGTPGGRLRGSTRPAPGRQRLLPSGVRPAPPFIPAGGATLGPSDICIRAARLPWCPCRCGANGTQDSSSGKTLCRQGTEGALVDAGGPTSLLRVGLARNWG